MPRSRTPPQPAGATAAQQTVLVLAHLTAPTPEKLTWLVEQYPSCARRDQAAIDLSLIALVPCRPWSTTPQA